MSEPLPSEIPDLFGHMPEDYWVHLDQVEQEKRFTGARAAANRALARSVVVELSRGTSQAEVARELGLSRNTVAALADRYADELSRRREQFGQRCLRVAAAAVQRVHESLPRMDGRDAASTASILIEKGLLLTGQATQRTEIKKIVELRPETIAGFWSPPPAVIDVAPSDSGSDGGPAQLPESTPQAAESSAPDTVPATDPADAAAHLDAVAARAAATAEGGGGGGGAAGGGTGLDGFCDTKFCS